MNPPIPLPPPASRALLCVLTALAPLLVFGQHTNRTPTLRSSNSAAFSGTSGGALAFGGAGTMDPGEMMRQVQQAAERAMEEASLAMSSGLALEAGAVAAVEPPLLVHVRPLAEPARGHWLEDLAVLDRLLREELAALEGRSAGQALGVRLRLTARGGAAPQWIEDHGVLLQGEVRVPLAAAPRRGNSQTGTNTTASAWERARVEVRNANGTRVVTRSHASGGGETFDPRRLEALDRAVAGVLFEARHLRELQAGESVTVTLAGHDDALAPRRVSYKVSQSDLSALAAGTLNEEQFRLRVKKGPL